MTQFSKVPSAVCLSKFTLTKVALLGWLRKALLKMDMADLKAKRPVPRKFAYKERVRRLLRTKKAQTAAANFAKSWRSVCMLVVKNKGDASGK